MSRTKKPVITGAGLFSLAVGLATGAVSLFLLLPGNVFAAIGLGLVGTVVGRIVAPRPHDKRLAPPRRAAGADTMVADGVTKQQLDTALRAGMDKLNTLKNEVFKIQTVPVRAEADAICATVARILLNIKNDPADLRRARQFLDYYLDATIKIVVRYVDLSSRGIRSDEITQTLSKVEDSLHTIHRAFERQLELLLQNDILDLDSELTVLTRTIEMEGLGELPGTGRAAEQDRDRTLPANPASEFEKKAQGEPL